MKRVIRNTTLGAAAIAAAVAAVAVSGYHASAASPAPKAPRACFFPREVNSWSAGPNHTVNFKVGAKRYFQGDLATSCPDIDWSLRIGIDTRGEMSVCTGRDLTIITNESPMGPQRCFVDNIRQLTPAEVAALPKRAKP